MALYTVRNDKCGMLKISFRCIIDAGDLNRIKCGEVIRLFILRRLQIYSSGS